MWKGIRRLWNIKCEIFYNVRFITESHPWPQDQVLKSSLFLPYFLYRNYLSITVSKLDRTDNVCIWPWTWRHFPIWSSNPVNETDPANILIINDFKKTWSQTLGFDSYCPKGDRHGNFTVIWLSDSDMWHISKFFYLFLSTFKKSSETIKIA